VIRLQGKYKRPLTVLGIVIFASSLLYAISALPKHGALNAPAHREVSESGRPTPGTYHARNAYKDAHTPNMVTVVLADYRSFDTLGETAVVFCGCVCVMLILRRKRPTGTGRSS
jgi:multicomponent Na+:H+ antiporter subunit B